MAEPGPISRTSAPNLGAVVTSSNALELERALDEACDAAELALSAAADGALVFASSDYATSGLELFEGAADRLGLDHVVVAGCARVLPVASERESGATLAVVGLTGGEVEFASAGLDSAALGASDSALDLAVSDLAAQLTDGAEEEDPGDALTLLFVDAHAVDGTRLCRALARAGLADAPLIGLACEGAAGSPAPLCSAGDSFDGGAIALRVRARDSRASGDFREGNGRRPRIAGAHGCRLVFGNDAAQPGLVTRCQGHWVLQIDGVPAVTQLRRAAGSAFGGDLDAAIRQVLVAASPGGSPARQWQQKLSLRRIVGVDEKRGAIALGSALAPGDRIAFAHRDGLAARSNLQQMLEPFRAGPGPEFGLYTTCSRRGEELFGEPGLEIAYVDSALRGAPLLGLAGPYQVASPGDGEVTLHTHTGVLATLG